MVHHGVLGAKMTTRSPGWTPASISQDATASIFSTACPPVMACQRPSCLCQSAAASGLAAIRSLIIRPKWSHVTLSPRGGSL